MSAWWDEYVRWRDEPTRFERFLLKCIAVLVAVNGTIWLLVFDAATATETRVWAVVILGLVSWAWLAHDVLQRERKVQRFARELADFYRPGAPVTFYGTLHPYQEDDVELMKRALRVLLVYEMGLGKTVMTIAAIEDLADEGQLDAGLVIAPSGLRYQWGEKIDQFTKGTAKWLVIDGPPEKRELQYQLAMSGEYRYVLVSYEQVVNDWKQVRRLPRDFLVGDEITAIKGFKAARSKRVKRLQAPYVYGLTGDPMDGGRLEEVYSIMQWVDERVLGRFDLFDRAFVVRNTYGSVKRYRNVKTFRQAMEGHWCRRTQDEPAVAPYLPKVQPPQTVPVQLDRAGKALYARIAKALQADLAEAAAAGLGGGFDLASNYGFGSDTGDNMAIRGKIMSKTQALLMLCDHPELLRHSARLYVSSKGESGSAYAYDLHQAGLLSSLKAAPKADAAVKLVERSLASPRSKVVLFSHDVPTLDYLQARIPASRKYHGGMNAKEKDAAVQAFQHDDEVRVLLSSDAGGYGLDLPAGNVVVNYDQPWTNGAAKQRNSRIIRASSEWPTVHHYDLLVRGSVDEWQHEKVGGKHAVSSAFVDGRGLDKKGGLALDLSSLSAFLREHAP